VRSPTFLLLDISIDGMSYNDTGLPVAENEAKIGVKRRKSVFAVLYCVLFLCSLGIVAFGLVMLKIAYDLQHPMEFLAVFFSASLVILIGAALALGFGLRAARRISKKN